MLSEYNMSNQFQHGLFGCFDNFGVCIITYFLPCYTAGKNAEAVGENCLLCGLVFLVPIANIFFPAQIRTKIREQKGLDGSFGMDLLLHLCCPCCSLVQEAQEVGSIGGGQAMSIARE